MKRLGLGCMRFPKLDPADDTRVDLAQVCQMVDTFLSQGFTYFDTAYMYHGGQSECVVRDALVRRHPRDSYVLADKLPTMQLKADGDQERIFSEQLTKCGVDYFDYYLLHNLGEQHYELAKRFDSFRFLSQIKAEGKVRHIGFSFHDSPELLDEILTAHPEVEFVQLQINYLDWENAGIQSRRCYETATRHQKPVIVMEPVKGGMLASIPEAASQLLQAAQPAWSPADWAIRFAAGLPNVMMVLSGMTTIEQLEGNIKSFSDLQPLTERE